MFWPADLSKREAELSIIPKLLETQDQFIAILSVPVADLEKLFEVVNASTLSANLFLKHLVVLADFGGEMIQRVNSRFDSLFPAGEMQYFLNGNPVSYQFKQLPVTRLNNESLRISGKRLLEKHSMNELLQDVVALLLFGSSSNDEQISSILSKCEIGSYLGQPDKLAKFIKQRYI